MFVASDWCHQIYKPDTVKGDAFSFEPEFEASSQATITCIRMYHDSTYLKG